MSFSSGERDGGKRELVAILQSVLADSDLIIAARPLSRSILMGAKRLKMTRGVTTVYPLHKVGEHLSAPDHSCLNVIICCLGDGGGGELHNSGRRIRN